MATAVAVPMKVIETASSCWEPLKELAAVGNMQCKSDLQVRPHIWIHVDCDSDCKPLPCPLATMENLHLDSFPLDNTPQGNF